MNAARWLALIMVVLSAGSAVAYSVDGDWRRALYWVAATVITIAVTI